MEETKGSAPLRVLRWIARGTSGLAALVILLFLVGEGFTEGLGPLMRLTVRETLMMVAFGAVALGLLLGWRWELLGGFATLVGLAAFYLLDYVFSGTLPRGPYFLLLASPSLLSVLSGLLRKTRSKAKST